MIKKKTFIECIEAIKKQNEIEHKVCDALELVVDGNFIPMFSETIFSQLLKVMEESMNDKDWISWWMFEKDFGRDKKMKGYHKNGRVIKLDTAEDLYKYLVKNYKK
ncbi:unnamed protein product [marine sediment metagenome]|uniref:Uncharacterized protein n=1 Tax=marine sediment metagenome TaxID=412755 RepID=X0VN77_9ZZZZ